MRVKLALAKLALLMDHCMLKRSSLGAAGSGNVHFITGSRVVPSRDSSLSATTVGARVTVGGSVVTEEKGLIQKRS